MTNLDATETTQAANRMLPRNALRRCWQTGYDAALENAELAYWVAGKGQARLEALCDERDADVTTAEGWSAWLMGYATALMGGESTARTEALDTVLEVAAEKVEELD